MNILKAKIEDLDEILELDYLVVGSLDRGNFIKESIERDNCFILRDNTIKALLIYDKSFFDNTFISLVVVHPLERRKGYASKLIKELIKTAPTDKIFSSTNKSNLTMKKVFKSLGFIESGLVENLDEGDPEIFYYMKKEA